MESQRKRPQAFIHLAGFRVLLQILFKPGTLRLCAGPVNLFIHQFEIFLWDHGLILGLRVL